MFTILTSGSCAIRPDGCDFLELCGTNRSSQKPVAVFTMLRPVVQWLKWKIVAGSTGQTGYRHRRPRGEWCASIGQEFTALGRWRQSPVCGDTGRSRVLGGIGVNDLNKIGVGAFQLTVNNPVPEPGTLMLMAAGVASLVCRWRRRS